MDCSPPGSSVHGILQARVMRWIAMPFSRGYSERGSSALSADSLPSEPPEWAVKWRVNLCRGVNAHGGFK